MFLSFKSEIVMLAKADALAHGQQEVPLTLSSYSH